MPIPGPSSEDSFSSYDELWAQPFSNLQTSESPLPLARPFSLITSSPSGRGGGAPRCGWSHLIYPPSAARVQRNVSSGAPVIFNSLPGTSSFDGPALAFPLPEPYLMSEHHPLEQTLRPHTTRSCSLHVSTRVHSLQSAQHLHQSSPSPRCVLPQLYRHIMSNWKEPFPTYHQPCLSRFEEDEKATIRHQLQEAMRTWPSAEQENEKQSMEFRREHCDLWRKALWLTRVFLHGA